MAAKGSILKKGSDASSKLERQPDTPVFFLDICLGRVTVPAALRDAGANVELHIDHFAPEAPDTEWLPEVGRRGWTILTKDRHLLTNQLEIVALLKSGAGAFVLRGADMSGDEMARAFVAALPTMQRFLEKFPLPFVAAVTKSGNVSILATFSKLIKKVR